MYRYLFSRAAVLVVLIAVLNYLADTFYWYSAIAPFDMVMHTLGGIFLALAGAALLYRLLKGQHWLIWLIVLTALVLIVGFLWEVFEFSVQGIMRVETLANIPDSLSDMICDMVGGIIGSLFVIWRLKRYNSTNDTDSSSITR